LFQPQKKKHTKKKKKKKKTKKKKTKKKKHASGNKDKVYERQVYFVYIRAVVAGRFVELATAGKQTSLSTTLPTKCFSHVDHQEKKKKRDTNLASYRS
jgi:hypothetical protein